MPTIRQLPVATSVSVSDVLPLSQGGTTKGIAVGNLLSSTQPALSLASGSLLGRVSASAGGPEPVSVGSGLSLGSGALAATGDDHTRLPISPSLTVGDEVVVNTGGAAKRMQATLLRSLFAAGSGVSIDSSGTISASAAGVGIASGTAGSGHLVLTRLDGSTVDCGPVLAVAEPVVPAVVADGPTGTDNWAVIQAALNTGRDVVLPRGEIRVSRTLTMRTSSQRLSGYGPSTRLRPDFVTGDVIAIGALGSPQIINVALRDFAIWPSVTKTSGAAVKAINGGHLRFSGVWAGSYEDATSGLLLFRGFELEGCGECVIAGGGALGCLENGILLYSASPSAEIIIEPTVQMALNGCAVHIGGGMGGVYVSGDIQLNGQGVVVSTSFSSSVNREIFLQNAIIDSNVREGFLAGANSIAASLVVNGGWCGGTAVSTAVGFSVLAGNAITIINGMRCDSNAGVGALFAGGPVVMSNFHAAQNHSHGIQVAATCGGIFSTGAKLTESITGVGWSFPPGYGYEVSITGGSVNDNVGGTFINPPNGPNQFIIGVVGFSSLFLLTPPTGQTVPLDGSGGATGWNFSNGGGEITTWNTTTSLLPSVSHEWRQKLAGGSNALLLQTGLSNGVAFANVGQTGTVWHSNNLRFSSDFSYDSSGHALSLSAPVVAGNAAPLTNGPANAGSSAAFARQDHVHPTDVTRYAAANPAGYQTAAQVSAAVPVAASLAPLAAGNAATGVSTAYARQDHVHPVDANRLAAASNLSDLASPSLARTNLGLAGVAASGSYSDLSGRPALGPVASLSIGTTGGTVAAGDDSRITGALSASAASATYAPLSSPALTGIPTVPTPGVGTNSGQVASTAFVHAVVGVGAGVATVTSGASYAMQTIDQVVLINKTLGSATAISLPAAPTLGVSYNVKDGRGDAATNPITITDPAGHTIDSATGLIINQARGAESLRWTGLEWSVF